MVRVVVIRRGHIQINGFWWKVKEDGNLNNISKVFYKKKRQSLYLSDRRSVILRFTVVSDITIIIMN